MTFATQIATPSIVMNNTFLNGLENMRGAALGEYSTNENTLSIRVSAISHTIFQLCYALLATIPMALTVAITILANPSEHILVDPDESIWGKLCIIEIIALATLYVPVIMSAWTAYDPGLLNDRDMDNGRVLDQLSKFFQTALLASTLPPLHKMHQAIESYRRPDNQSFMEDLFSKAAVGLASMQSAQKLLKEFNTQAYQWRFYLIAALEGSLKSASTDLKIFDISSKEFLIPFTDAILQAIESPENPTCHISAY